MLMTQAPARDGGLRDTPVPPAVCRESRKHMLKGIMHVNKERSSRSSTTSEPFHVLLSGLLYAL
jgi:hypothetical protein